MSRHGPIFNARTSGWGFEEWAHEARILRETQEAIMQRRRDENERRDRLTRVATLLLQYGEVKKDEEEQGGDDE